MTRLLHTRGDITGMFLLLSGLLFGLWQVVIAWKRLNGMSLTGYPDRRWASLLLGIIIISGSGAWYFTRPNHFASPDLEGIETLAVLVFALFASTAMQALLAQAAGRVRTRSAKTAERAGGDEEVLVPVGEDRVPGSLFVGGGTKANEAQGRIWTAMLLHDHGGSRRDMAHLARRLSSEGFTCLTIELDGHGDSPRAMSGDGMDELLDAAKGFLKERTGGRAPIIVGVGLGGNIALRQAEGASKVVLLDPVTTGIDCLPEVNALRELRPFDVFSSMFRPPARGERGKRVSLWRELSCLKEESPGVCGEAARSRSRNDAPGVSMIAPRDRWFTDPTALHMMAFSLGPLPPVLVDARHSTIATDPASIEAVAVCARDSLRWRGHGKSE